MHYKAITNLLSHARDAGLKWPKIRLETASGAKLVLSLSGARARYPNSTNVTDGGRYGENEWYGRIHTDGRLEESRWMTDGVRDKLTELSSDPAESATLYGALTGRCCFCGKALTTKESVGVGYGPICAGHFGLPWGETAPYKEKKAATIDALVFRAHADKDTTRDHPTVQPDSPRDIAESKLKTGPYDKPGSNKSYLLGQILDCFYQDDFSTIPGLGSIVAAHIDDVLDKQDRERTEKAAKLPAAYTIKEISDVLKYDDFQAIPDLKGAADGYASDRILDAKSDWQSDVETALEGGDFLALEDLGIEVDQDRVRESIKGPAGHCPVCGGPIDGDKIGQAFEAAYQCRTCRREFRFQLASDATLEASR